MVAWTKPANKSCVLGSIIVVNIIVVRNIVGNIVGNVVVIVVVVLHGYLLWLVVNVLFTISLQHNCNIYDLLVKIFKCSLKFFSERYQSVIENFLFGNQSENQLGAR